MRLSNGSRRWTTLILSLLLVNVFRSPANCCPFCKPAAPTFAQLRERADICVVAEGVAADSQDSRFVLRQIVQGENALRQLNGESSEERPIIILPGISAKVPPGQLSILLCNTDPDAPAVAAWSVFPVNELECAYYLRAPGLRTPAVDRLRYFAKYLEHVDEQLAADAYLEFAFAPYDVVRQAADFVASAKLRQWLDSPQISDERKGLYALLLGSSRDPRQTASNAEFLRTAVVRQARLTDQDSAGDDFKAGFDGLLGGFLVATGESGLALIDETILRNPAAADGNLRHTVTALRFAQEYLKQIPAARVSRSIAELLTRPSFAATAIVDLARSGDTEALPRIVALYEQPYEEQPAIRRAIVGYLMTINQPVSLQALASLRRRDPGGVTAAENAFEKFGSLGVTGAR